MITVPESLIRLYVSQLTVGIHNHRKLPPNDVREYRRQVVTMKSLALRNGELATLRAGMEHALMNRAIDCTTFYVGRFRVTSDWMRELMYFAWQAMSPDLRVQTVPVRNDVRIVSMALPQWRELNASRR